jgi:tetratricopeptide (TPR) repeat protein
VAIDRDETLKKAEKLLRQGRLEAAIAEYQRVVDAFPRDWNTANTLGDCFYRAHQVESAAAQYDRIADHFLQEGFFPKAAALYKKSLKINPHDEHALRQAAEIAIRQGTLAEAKQYLGTLAERRRASGDAKGAAAILLRIGTLDPDDLEARLAAARASAAAGAVGAGAEFRAIAEGFASRDQRDRAIDVLGEAAQLAPADEALRSALVAHCAAQGQIDRALEYASSASELVTLADALEAQGDAARALQVLERVAATDPSRVVSERLVRGYAAAGDPDRARAHLDTLGDINETGLLQIAAELRADAGDHEASRGLFARLLAREPRLAPEVATRGAGIAGASPEAALVHVESAAETLLLHGDFAGAAAAYQAFLEHQPKHVTASLRLVEICVDGELDALEGAQAALADAYVAAGRGAEALAVAEDLATTHPGDAAHVDRLRQALVLTGAPDVEAALAERLAAGSLASTDDLGIDLSDEEPEPTPPPSRGRVASARPADSFVVADAPDADPTVSLAASGLDASSDEQFRLGPIAIDLGDILGEDLEAGQSADADRDGPEVDLSDALAELKANPAAAPPPRPAPPSLEGVFAEFRDEVARQTHADAVEQHYKVGLTYAEMGMVAEAMKELEIAVRSPRYRFDAASHLARLALGRGRSLEAIEWFERAAEAPAPTAEAGRALLYELADTLETGGETARALAVFLELQADTADFRDVSRRVERLARAQAGG